MPNPNFFQSPIQKLSHEEEEHLLKIIFLSFPPVKKLLIECRIIMCGQKKPQEKAIIDLIENTESKALLEKYKIFIGRNIQFSNRFENSFKQILCSIIKNENFKNDSILDIYIATIKTLTPEIGILGALMTVQSARERAQSFAEKIPNFFSEEARQIFAMRWEKARQDFVGRWQEITNPDLTKKLHHDVRQQFTLISLAALIIALYSLDYVDGITTILFSGGLIGMELYPLLTIYYSQYFSSNETNARLDALCDSLIRFEKVEFSMETEIRETRISLEPLSMNFSQAQNTPPLPSSGNTTVVSEPLDNREGGGEIKKTKKRTSSAKDPQKKHAASRDNKTEKSKNTEVVSLFGGEYIYNPKDLKKSTLFPITGSLAERIFYVAIKPEVREDIAREEKLPKNSEKSPELFDRFKSKIENGVSFSKNGENLKPLQEVSLEDPDTGKKLLCYELRLLGKHGDDRLVGPARSVVTDAGKEVLLVELTTFVKAAHTPDKLNRSVSASQAKVTSYNK